MQVIQKSIAPEDEVLPAALLLGEKVRTIEVGGFFDELNQTWSNRNYEDIGQKKHNEAM